MPELFTTDLNTGIGVIAFTGRTKIRTNISGDWTKITAPEKQCPQLQVKFKDEKVFVTFAPGDIAYFWHVFVDKHNNKWAWFDNQGSFFACVCYEGKSFADVYKGISPQDYRSNKQNYKPTKGCSLG